MSLSVSGLFPAIRARNVVGWEFADGDAGRKAEELISNFEGIRNERHFGLDVF